MRGLEREPESAAVCVEAPGNHPGSLSPSGFVNRRAQHGREDQPQRRPEKPRRRARVALEIKHESTGWRESSPDVIIGAWSEFKATGSVHSRDLLIIHYMSGHVRRIAHRLSAQLPRQIDPEDLVQHVYRGLVRLIERFDPERDVQFETFSSRRLVGAMRDYLRDLDTSGRQSRQRCKRLRDVETRFLAMHGRRPDECELQMLLDLPDEVEFRKFVDDARAPLTVSFASGGPDGGGAGSGSGGSGWDDADGFAGFSDQRLPAPVTGIEREDLRRWLTEGLSRRDRLIVILYYYEQMTMKEIGQTLGCSESRVSQRLDSIIKCLRSRLSRVGAGALE